MYSNLGKSKSILAVYIDLTRAFETVCHPLLLLKLSKLNFHTSALSLLNSYLSNRIQLTVINNIMSKSASNNVGIPQGTILAPLLFNRFINDFLLSSDHSLNICFADDTLSLYEIPNTSTTATEQIISSLNNTYTWFKTNLLVINSKKSYYTIYNTRNSPSNHLILIAPTQNT